MKFKKKKKTLLILFLVLLNVSLQAQSFYNTSNLQKIHIFFTATNWDYKLDTANAGTDSYIVADSIFINGKKLDSVGVKYKGYSSYSASNVKNPFHISLNEYKNQSYQGFNDIKLANGFYDPSMIREVLAYDILSNYMDCPRANFAQVYVNNTYLGLYTNDESINKKFCGDHFYSSGNSFVKCEPSIGASLTVKSDLVYKPLAIDSSSYFNYYELKSQVGWNDFVSLIDTINNYPTNLEYKMDMDRLFWMLAFNNVTINLDSYSGTFEHNYYLYKDNNKRYNPIIWDMNLAFGGIPFSGVGASGLGQLTIPQEKTYSAFTHSVDPYWPLINVVMNNPRYKRMYVAHMKTMLNEMFLSNLYQTKATQFQATIDTAVFSDANKFYTYSQFQNGMTTDYPMIFFSVLPYNLVGISNLMAARTAYLLSTPNFTYTAPSISTPTLSNVSPAFGTSVSVISSVLNTNAVFLGYRNNISDKFTKIQMFDDGLHNDLVAGDNIYGASITIKSGLVHYYIYAENSNAGMFSPQRAEHEYYSIIPNSVAPTPGKLFINELLAINTLLQKDEYSKNEDWLELYNTSSEILDLSNSYLSDTYLQPMKWKFPNGTKITPNGFLIVWADNDSLQHILHTNFSFNGSGDHAYLSQGTTLLDSVTFGVQAANITYGRCPNGTGPFSLLPIASYNTYNCSVDIQTIPTDKPNIKVFPNPSSSSFNVVLPNNFALSHLVVYDILGKILHQTEFNHSVEVSVLNLESGIYFIKVNEQVVKVQVIR